jgi:hypothetical protein
MMIKQAVAVLLGALSVLPAFAGQTLDAETQLEKGQYLSTRSGLYSLVVQTDGNLVKYWIPNGYGAGTAYPVAEMGYPYKQSFPTNTRNGDHLRMQMDGNLALYTSGNTWAWNSKTGGKPYNMGLVLVLQEDGSVTIRDRNRQWTIVETLSSPHRQVGTNGYFPVRRYVNGQCYDSLMLLNDGVTANRNAGDVGGTVGYCNQPY